MSDKTIKVDKIIQRIIHDYKHQTMLYLAMKKGLHKYDIRAKKQETYFKNIAVKGNTDLKSRQIFVNRIIKMIKTDGWIGMLGANTYCVNAKNAGATWLKENDTTKEYLNLNVKEFLLGNTFKSKMLMNDGWVKEVKE